MLREPPSARPDTLATSRQNAQKSRDLSGFALLPQFIRPHRAAILAGLSAVLVAGGTTLALGRLFQHLVDQGLRAGDKQALESGLFILLALVLVLALASYTRLVLLTGTTERIMAGLRHRLMAHLLRQDTGWFDSQKKGDLMARMGADITLLQTLFGNSMPVALRNLVLVSGGIVMMAMSSPALSCLVLLLVPVLVLVLVLIGPSVRRSGRILQDETGLLGAHLNENLHAIREIQAFGKEQAKEQAFAAINEQVVAATWRYIRRRGLLSSLVIFTVFSSIAGLLWFGGAQVIAGQLSPGQLSAFVFYALLVAGSSGTLSEIYGDMLRAAGALERIGAILHHTPEITASAGHAGATNPPPASGGTICFNAVGFAYAARPEQKILDGLSLEFREGETVALVGPSGAGKTSILALLLRFYDPQHGTITLNGVDIRRFDPAAYRALFGLVPQDPTLFSTSIRDNITFGDSTIDDRAVQQAAIQAGAHDFIRTFPDGYDTLLGERGARLSGGQIQRIALARALLRQPAILLLDEATAHLDSETEETVQRALQQSRHLRTTIMIAHRLSSIRHADRILVLDQGRVVASGTHTRLLEENELYRRLAATQFQNI